MKHADDIDIAQNAEDAQNILNQVMWRVSSRLEEHSLDLATEKTEILLITQRRISTITEIHVDVKP